MLSLVLPAAVATGAQPAIPPLSSVSPIGTGPGSPRGAQIADPPSGPERRTWPRGTLWIPDEGGFDQHFDKRPARVRMAG